MFVLTSCQQQQVISLQDGELYYEHTIDAVNLKGEWNFYPHRLLEPNALLQNDLQPEKMSIPGFWKQNIQYGTYHLRINFPEQALHSVKALHLPQIFSAYKLWINDNLIIENGKVARIIDDEVPRGIPKTVFFAVEQRQVDILLQVSNFHHRNGGVADTISIGNPAQIIKADKQNWIVGWFSIGAIAIIALIHIVIYWFRKVDKIFMYFGLFSLLIGLRVMLIGDPYIYHFFPNIRWEIVQKFNFIIIFAIIPLFTKYFTLLYPNSKWGDMASRITAVISLLCIVFISLTNNETLVTKTAYIIYLLIAIMVIHLLFVVLKAIKNKEVGAKIVCIFLLILLGTAINDLLYDSLVIHSMILNPLGFVAYCGAQAYVLSIKYSHANLKADSLHEELETTQNEVIFTLGQIIEKRSNETGNHVRRVAEYSKLLALKYGLSKSETEKIKLASVMHDVGKIGIPDAILNKPGKLTEEEFEVIKTHTKIGYELLKPFKRDLMKTAATIALTHHERYDGTGYPNRIKGKNIPLYGRIVAIADVFDALSSDRAYKKAWSMEEVVAYFQEQKGKQFDPKLVEIFLGHIDEFMKVKLVYQDKYY